MRDLVLLRYHEGETCKFWRECKSCPPGPVVHWLILAQRGAPAHDAERPIFMIQHMFDNIETMGDRWAYYNLSVGMNMTYNNAPFHQRSE